MAVGKSSTPTIPTYNVGVHFVLCHGPIDKITKIVVDERTAWAGTSTGGAIVINSPDLFGGKLREGGITGVVDVAMGGTTQVANTYMTSKLGVIPAFRGVVSVILNQVYVGMNYYLKPWQFLATRVHIRKNGVPQWQDGLSELPASTSGLPIPANLVTLGRTGVNSNLVFDAPHGLVIGSIVKVEGATDPLYNGTFTIQSLGFTTTTASYVMTGTPAANATGSIKVYGSVETISGLINAVHVIRDCLTDNSWGLGHSEGLIHEASFLAAAQTCYNEGLGFGFLWNKDGTVIEFINEVLKHIQGNIYLDRKDGLFHINLVRKVTSPGSLLVLNSSNTREVTAFKRKSLGDLTSEVTVKFLDNVTYKENSVTVSDSALAQRQSTPISKIIEYSGVATSEVASKLAIRDLSQLSIPLYSCDILCTREAENLNPGDAFVLDWPDYIDAQLIMRVVSINLGTATKNAITIEALEDVFNAPTTYYETPPLSNWTSPISDPIAVSLRLLNEAPYYIVATTQGDAFAQGVASTSTYIAVAGSSPTPDSISASIWSTTGTTYEENGVMDFCFSGLLSADMDRVATSITVVSPLDIDLLTVNHFIQIDNELMEVTAITGTQLTVIRGVLDTIPTTHSMNARMYGWHDWFASDLVEYITGETAKVKLTTLTPKGELSLAAAPESTLLTVGRLHRPYPPGNMKVDGIYWPTLVLIGGNTFDVTYATRNRIQQTAGLIGFYTGNITTEPSVTYSGTLIRTDTLAVLDSFTGETLTTHTLTTTYRGQVRLELWSVRAGIDSFQHIFHTFTLATSTWDGVPSTWDAFTTWD